MSGHVARWSAARMRWRGGSAPFDRTSPIPLVPCCRSTALPFLKAEEQGFDRLSPNGFKTASKRDGRSTPFDEDRRIVVAACFAVTAGIGMPILRVGAKSGRSAAGIRRTAAMPARRNPAVMRMAGDRLSIR